MKFRPQRMNLFYRKQLFRNVRLHVNINYLEWLLILRKKCNLFVARSPILQFTGMTGVKC